MTSILMVCLGNICRSPLAEGLLRKKVDPKNTRVDSAGTSNYHVGSPPDERMIATAKNYDLDISMLRGRQFTVEDFDEFDHIYVMDNSNYNDVISLARNEEDKKKVDFILNLCKPHENADVPDPYFGGQQGFENVYQLLDECTDLLVEQQKNS